MITTKLQLVKRNKSDISYPQQPCQYLVNNYTKAESQSTKSKVKIIKDKRIAFSKRVIIKKVL